MSTLTDFIVNYGNVIELDFPKWDCVNLTNILNKHPGWVYYQPHKLGYNRYGLSVTSLDGKFTGEPDLYSLREYAQLTGKVYTEQDFKIRTNVTAFMPEIDDFLNFWEPNLGRVHFLKLNKGGFFPPHRDNGLVLDVQSFRILVPICNFGRNDMKWIQNEEVLDLKIGYTYFINTCLPHSLFSFVDNCIMLVLNVMVDDFIIEKMVKKIVPV
jgi:hypothetical protein